MMAVMPAPFETATGFLLSRLGSLAQRSWLDLLAEHAVTPHQHAVLLVMRDSGPIGQQDLTRAIGVDPRNVVPVIDGLVGPQLVHRAIDPQDRRRRLLSLTPKGRATADALAKGAERIEHEFLRGLTDDDQQQLNTLLQKLLARHNGHASR
jgi:DNA-binding MarR family transcriptional regulator